MLQQMDGIRAGRCLDAGPASRQPGGPTQVYPSIREWFQFVSFGDGRVAPAGSLYTTIPSYIVSQTHALGHEQIPYMCLGVYNRGTEDAIDWEDKDYAKLKSERDALLSSQNNSDIDWKPLSEWNGEQIITTQCTNLGAVIEWVYVPFIAEDDAVLYTDDSMNSSDVKEESSEPSDQEL